MSPTLIIAQKEIRDNLRNRWVLAATILMFALALALGFMGSTPTGSVKVDPLTVTVVSLSSLSIFLVPLIAMLMSYDALIGEIERGTMALLLSYPISRWQILVGKFIGHTALHAIATLNPAMAVRRFSGCRMEAVFPADCRQHFARRGVFVAGLSD